MWCTVNNLMATTWVSDRDRAYSLTRFRPAGRQAGSRQDGIRSECVVAPHHVGFEFMVKSFLEDILRYYGCRLVGFWQTGRQAKNERASEHMSINFHCARRTQKNLSNKLVFIERDRAGEWFCFLNLFFLAKSVTEKKETREIKCIKIAFFGK